MRNFSRNEEQSQVWPHTCRSGFCVCWTVDQPNPPVTRMDLIATSAFGLEAVVSREIVAMGYESRIIQPGRILFEGDENAICQANIWLRGAERVLVRLGAFEAVDFGQLFDRTFALPWEEWVPPDAEFPVKGRSIKSQLSSVPACQKIVKKAIVEKLKKAHGVDRLDETGPRVTIEVALLEDLATLTIDTSGTGLHKRGYRTLSGPAPLRETLAAAMVMLSFWQPDRQLIDPFCGTGTIPIEVAMIGRNIAPGLNRSFAAEAWPRIESKLWETTRGQARRSIQPELPLRIIGTDADEKVLSLARYHAKKAGVEKDIHFQCCDFTQLTSKKQFGCVICNPPYGERIGEQTDVQKIYTSIPDVLRRLQTWSHYILTSNPNFEQLVGQKADRRRKLYNGRIECTYFQFYGPKPGTRIAEVQSATSEQASDNCRAAFGGLLPESTRQANEFANRLIKLARHLRRWPTRRGITCYRLYDRDIPEIPLIIDRYEECLHITEYERPHSRSAAQHADWLDMMVETAGRVLDVPSEKVFLKRRKQQKGTTQHERYANEERTFDVSEGGLLFRVNLSDYVDTGLFLDHRITRSMVRDRAKGTNFLNLFGYTGAFTVYAASGGAITTTTVDLSKTYIDWLGQNMSLNGFGDQSHRFIRSDVVTFMKQHDPEPTYNLAVVDPPTFSNSKEIEHFWDIQRDYSTLLNRLIKFMRPGGLIFFSTNFRRFKFDEGQIKAASIREITRQTIPEDFRNKRIHRCWQIFCR